MAEADETFEHLPVLRLDVVFLATAAGPRRSVIVGFDEPLDVPDACVPAERESAGATHFEAVPLARIMRGGNHHAAVRGK